MFRLHLCVCVGTQALFFAAIGVRTHAFDPQPMDNALLRCSLASNTGMDAVMTLNGYGLGDTDTDHACLVRACMCVLEISAN